MKKKLDKSQLRDTLQNSWPVIFKTIKVIENKENLKNCHIREEPKNNVMWQSGWDPKTNKQKRH